MFQCDKTSIQAACMWFYHTYKVKTSLNYDKLIYFISILNSFPPNSDHKLIFQDLHVKIKQPNWTGHENQGKNDQ